MNLPAVILFISFSAVYGLQCRSGGKSIESDGDGKGENVISTPISKKECPSNNDHPTPFCIRDEFIYSEGTPEQGTYYTCTTDAPKEMCYFKKESKLDCIDYGLGSDWSRTPKEFREQVKELKARVKVCCSTDPEFKGLPSLLSDGKDSSPSDNSSADSSSDKSTASSSAFSTRALLAIITALLGLIF